MREAVLTRDLVLRAIHQLQQHCPSGIARTSDLANRLGVKEPSVTARVQKLARGGLVRYVLRRGATLTEEGERLALAASVRLRLVERFLREVLCLPADCVAAEAEQLIRHVSDRTMDSIAGYFAKPLGALQFDALQAESASIGGSAS